MLRGSDISRNVWSSLTFRVLGLMTLAMAPIGGMSIYQTSELTARTEERAAASLLSATVDAVTPEIAALERVIGAATAMSLLTVDIWNRHEACVLAFSRVSNAEASFHFAGVLTRDGALCVPDEISLSHSEMVTAAMTFENDAPFEYSQAVNETGDVETVIAQPVAGPDGVTHYVLIGARQNRFLETAARSDAARAEALITFSQSGAILNANAPAELAAAELPAGRDISELTSPRGYTLQGETQAGKARIYSVVPIHGDLIFALGSWTPENTAIPGAGTRMPPWFFPILTWLATLAILYIAVSRFVVRHVELLGQRMRRFARNRTMPLAETDPLTPSEFTEMNRNFLAMAEAILKDEAELEQVIHDKTLLVREVHHRVKNNLQLIASIMNMQIRKNRDSETGEVVKRLQDRVLGLAAIHRQMYQSQSLDRVPADALVEAVLDQTLRLDPGVEVHLERDLMPLNLVLDQAIPLALLSAEAAANALHHLGATDGGRPKLAVKLEPAGEEEARLRVSNTVAAEDASEEGLIEFPGQGLGAQLINAFARQLGAEAITRREDGLHHLEVTFRPNGLDHADVAGPVARDLAKGGGSGVVSAGA